jgi:uncharacterized protein YndB with AHSA1/START domain
MSTTHIRQHINAPREKVYQLLLDRKALPNWKVPDGMSLTVHEFEAKEGGTLRISLTYTEHSERGKTTAHTDTYHGSFLELVPNERIVEEDEFETNDPALQGKMLITISLKERAGGTELEATHENLPSGVSPTDNETGWRMSIDKLAELAES